MHGLCSELLVFVQYAHRHIFWLPFECAAKPNSVHVYCQGVIICMPIVKFNVYISISFYVYKFVIVIICRIYQLYQLY